MSTESAVGAATAIDGAAPHGAWWVALRHNRFVLLAALGAMLVLVAGMLWHRIALVNNFVAAGVDDIQALKNLATGDPTTRMLQFERVREIQTIFKPYFDIFRLAMALLPAVVGAALGVATLSREFDRRTQVFALSQSVSVSRWWATKIVVNVVPLAIGFAALGFLFRSTADAWGPNEWNPLQPAQLAGFGWMPPATFALSFCAGVAVSSLVRSSIPALVGAFALTAGMFALLFTQYTTLVPAQRALDPGLGYIVNAPAGALILSNGMQDLAGQDVPLRYDCPSVNAATTANPGLNSTQIRVLEVQCLRGQGVVASYTEFIPQSSLPRLTVTILGLAALLAAAFLAVSRLLLRRRIV